MVTRPPWSDLQRNAVRRDDVAADFRLALEDGREPRVRQAYALATLDNDRHYRYESAITLEEYAERYGLEGGEARTLAHAGRAMRLVDGLEEAFLAGEVSMRSAKELWLTCRPRDHEPVDKRRPLARWLALAKCTSTRTFARVARHARVAERLGEPPTRLEFLLSQKALGKWRRVKVIARHKEKRSGLCEEEVLELVFDHYLQTFDVWARKNGKRRLPDTRDVDGRYVPVSVRRYVWERDGGRCVFPGCNWEGEIHFGHVVAHAKGGSREGDNICCECPLHNEMEREGDVRVHGPAHAPRFEWRSISGTVGNPYRPYWMDEASRKRRADLAAHRHLGVPLPAPESEDDGLTDFDLHVPPCADASSEHPGWVEDRRLRVPFLDAIDTTGLDRFLDEFFGEPSSDTDGQAADDRNTEGQAAEGQATEGQATEGRDRGERERRRGPGRPGGT